MFLMRYGSMLLILYISFSFISCDNNGMKKNIHEKIDLAMSCDRKNVDVGLIRLRYELFLVDQCDFDPGSKSYSRCVKQVNKIFGVLKDKIGSDYFWYFHFFTMSPEVADPSNTDILGGMSRYEIFYNEKGDMLLEFGEDSLVEICR